MIREMAVVDEDLSMQRSPARHRECDDCAEEAVQRIILTAKVDVTDRTGLRLNTAYVRKEGVAKLRKASFISKAIPPVLIVYYL